MLPFTQISPCSPSGRILPFSSKIRMSTLADTGLPMVFSRSMFSWNSMNAEREASVRP